MSGFKAILPTHGARGSKSESQASGSSTPFRVAVGGNDNGGEASGSADVARSEEKPKRKRKVHGKVAIIACLECRRTRSRCDGEAMKPCIRCRTRGYRCVYQPHTKIQKDEILNDLEQERAKAESLIERNHHLSMILQVISSDGHLDEIIQRLRRKEDAKSIATWLSSLPESQLLLRQASLAPTDIEEIIENLRETYNIRDTEFIEDEAHPFRVKWTQVTDDAIFLDHLVKLYLDRIHPNCMLFDEMAFVQTCRTGDGAACSKALFNAMCAIACNILDRRYIGTEQDASNVAHLNEAFLAEARASISLADSQDITTIQAMAVMYLADLSNGKARSAITYLKCASENLRSLETELDLTPGFDLSRWGILSLDM